MRLEEYTDDVICNAMGLGQFEPAGSGRAIRLLLKPSFHPEVCITLEPMRLSVVALRSMLWREPVPARMPELREEVTLSNATFETTVEAFNRAATENAAESRRICLDGMAISALFRSDGERKSFSGHPLGPEQARFAAGLLWLAHSAATSVYIRNRIAECGRYVDLSFKVEPEPEPPAVTQILVLGTPEDRAEHFEELRRKTTANDFRH